MSKLVGMLKAITSGAADAVKSGNLGKVAEIIDEYKLTEDEIAQAEVEYEKELTKRLEADMASDSTLAKSVRPLGFLVWTAMILFIILTDGNIW